MAAGLGTGRPGRGNFCGPGPAELDARSPLPSALGIHDAQLRQLVADARRVAGEDETWMYEALAARAADSALFLSAPGKISYMTYSDKWSGVRLKNLVPNVLDFASFRLREGKGQLD